MGGEGADGAAVDYRCDSVSCISLRGWEGRRSSWGGVCLVSIWEIRGLSGYRCLSRLLLICVLVIDGLPLGYHFIGMHALLHLEHGVRGHPVNLSHLFRTFLDCGAFRGALGTTQDDRRRARAASSCLVLSMAGSAPCHTARQARIRICRVRGSVDHSLSASICRRMFI